jgi:hypothetical protein
MNAKSCIRTAYIQKLVVNMQTFQDTQQYKDISRR